METLDSVLVCPYTLMEEEPLAWAVLLFGRVLLLHPYPLSLPLSCREAVDKGHLHILGPSRTPEEMKEKDRVLRELERYSANLPGKEYIRYLAGTLLKEEPESQDAILAALRGISLPQEGEGGLDGSILLCGIHQLILQKWEVDQALAAVADQERKMFQNLMEDGELEPLWRRGTYETDPLPGFELKSPKAWDAWKVMKKQWCPDPLPWITDQVWVWHELYGLAPEEQGTPFFQLPPLPSMSQAISMASQKDIALNEIRKVLLQSLTDEWPWAKETLRQALTSLGLVGEGTYSLFLPPLPAKGEGTERLFLLYPGPFGLRKGNGGMGP